MAKSGFIVLFVSGLLCGCAPSSGVMSSDFRPPARGSLATITVDNRRLADISVYAMVGETRVRLGAVQTLSNRTFTIPHVIPLPSEIGLYATARSDEDSYATLPIAVRPGDSILFIVENAMKFSMLLRR